MWLFRMIRLIFTLLYVADVSMFKYPGVYITFDYFTKSLHTSIFNLLFNHRSTIGEPEIDEFFKPLIFIEKRNTKEKRGIVMLRKRFKFKLGGVLKDTDFFSPFMNYWYFCVFSNFYWWSINYVQNDVTDERSLYFKA